MTLDDQIMWLTKITEAANNGRALDAALDEFAAVIRKDERDVCLALIAETMGPPMSSTDDAYLVLNLLADKIRDRG